MKILSLQLENFRNFKKLSLSPAPYNLISGFNGTGKTSILESIYFALNGRSFRESSISRLIRNESSTAFVELILNTDTGKQEIRFQLSPAKRFSHNGQKIRKMSQFYSLYPVIYFGRESLDLFRSGPKVRRHFLDSGYAKASSIHLRCCQQYKKLIQMKNQFLQQNIRKKEFLYLRGLNEQIAKIAARLVFGRLQFMLALEQYCARIITGFTLKFRYFSSFNAKFGDCQAALCSDCQQKLDEFSERELQRGHSLVGPHRDNFDIYLNGKSVTNFASTGQCKWVVLALNSAFASFLKDKMNKPPIWLLDDLMGDLDNNSLKMFASWIDPASQVMLTILPQYLNQLFLHNFNFDGGLWHKHCLESLK
ncbi:DNA replication/repair protein RecF [Candidatus Riflebacteria bacterium]